MRRHAVTLVLLAAVAALATDMIRTEAAGLRFAVPRPWNRVPAASDVRAAQWNAPRAAGDAEDAEVVLFFFGKGKGGGVDENLDRWYGQFSVPDGRAARDAAVVTIRTVNGLRVTAVDLAGTYKPGQMASGPLPPPKRDFRMLAAVIEGDEGPWFLKMTGPQRTIAAAKGDFDAVIASLTPHR
jgi:hypothetical protein